MIARPLNDRVIVRRAPAKEMEHGMHLPQQAQERPSRGEVLSIGPKVSQVEVGEVVIFGKFAGTDLDPEEFDDEKGLVIMREEEIVAKLDPSDLL